LASLVDADEGSRYCGASNILGAPVARTPNFNYEKQQRDNAKAAKKAAKAEAKAARKPDAAAQSQPENIKD
jgi:hypothetical protein